MDQGAARAGCYTTSPRHPCGGTRYETGDRARAEGCPFRKTCCRAWNTRGDRSKAKRRPRDWLSPSQATLIIDDTTAAPGSERSPARRTVGATEGAARRGDTHRAETDYIGDAIASDVPHRSTCRLSSDVIPGGRRRRSPTIVRSRRHVTYEGQYALRGTSGPNTLGKGETQ